MSGVFEIFPRKKSPCEGFQLSFLSNRNRFLSSMHLLITICVNFLKLSVEKLDFKPLWDNKLIEI